MKKRDEGLTLLEVIIGLSIASVIFVILLAAMRAGHRAQEKGLALQESSQRIRILSDRLAWLVRGAYPYMVETPEGKTLYFSGLPGRVGFVTSSVDARSGQTEDLPALKWIEIFVDGEGLKTREKIFYTGEALDGAGGKEYLLDRTVKELRISYLDLGKERTLRTWTAAWAPEEKEYLPSAVKMELALEVDGKKIELPPITAAIRGGHRP